MRYIWFMPGACITAALLLASCGAASQKVSRRTVSAAIDSLTPGLRSGPCTSGGVSIGSLTDTAADEGFSFLEDVDSERIGRGIATFIQRLPQGVSAHVETVETQGDAKHYSLSYSYQNIPVCDLTSRIHLLPSRIVYTGTPKFHDLAGQKINDTALGLFSDAWSDQNLVLQALADRLKLPAKSSLSIQVASKCVALDPAQVTPLWDLRVLVNGTPFDLLGNNKDIRSVHSPVLFANGQATYYRNNPRTGSLAELDLPDLIDGVSTLNGKRFSSFRSDSVERVKRDDRQYLVAPNDDAFDEVNVYANAERIARWLSDPTKGYGLDCLPISLELVSTIETKTGPTTDNARYYPPKKGSSEAPKIRIAPGGTNLFFLRQDYDVLAHEMGHHVLSRNLGGATFESIAIQEGLADFLVYAQTNDPCLAESICPENARSGCSIEGRCLRSGLNSSDFDPLEKIDAYGPGEVISSLLWTLGSRTDFGLDNMARIVLTAVNYFKKESQFQDLFVALYAADQQLNNGANACRIDLEAKKRGFGDVLAEISCADYEKSP